MKKWLAAIALLLATGGVAGYYALQQNQSKLTAVTGFKVVRGKIEAKVYATGTVDMVNKEVVQLLNPAIVKNVAVKLGQQVKKGDVLLQLDTTNIDLQLKQAQANVVVAQTNVNAAAARVSELESLTANSGSVAAGSAGTVGTGSLTDAKNALLQAQAALKQAEAGLNIVQKQKDSATIRADLDGTVLEIDAAANQPAAAQMPLMIVGDMAHLEVDANVNEVDASKLVPGQKVTISGTTLGNRRFTGSVYTVAPMAQSETSAQGTQVMVPVTVTLNQSDPALKPGFTVNLTVITANKANALQIPLEAVFTRNSNSYVYLVRNGILEQVQVTMGIIGDVNVEVTLGLKQGDVIVLNPSQNLSTGMRVKVE